MNVIFLLIFQFFLPVCLPFQFVAKEMNCEMNRSETNKLVSDFFLLFFLQ